MLTDTPGELANTIIHELTHGTLFIPDSMTFNENLATFIGNKGAENFLAYKYGFESPEYREYFSGRSDSRKFTQYVVKHVQSLDSLYNSMLTVSDSIRELKKNAFINNLAEGLQYVDFINQEGYSMIYSSYKPNNAYFISFLNYRERQDEFNDLYKFEHKENLFSFIDSWKQEYSN